MCRTPHDFADSLQPVPTLSRLFARSITQPVRPTAGSDDERERYMRRTVLSATAAACVAVLASTVPAFASGADSSATPRPAASAPSARPSAPVSAEPSEAPSAVPTRVPSRAATPVPSVAPGERRGQVGVVPSGAPNTGVTTGSESDGMLIGGSSAGVLAVGGAAVFLVRRRRATGV